VWTIDERYRSVYKVHFGEQTELLYKLATYGVPVGLMPISSTGTLKFDNHRALLNVARTKMMMMRPEGCCDVEIVECPRFQDVVIRKGLASRYNPGNTFYRLLLENYSLEHSKGDNIKKAKITMLVMKEIESQNGRFLKWLKWEQMYVVYTDRDQVRKVIAAAFRQYNRQRVADLRQLKKPIKDAELRQLDQPTEIAEPRQLDQVIGNEESRQLDQAIESAIVLGNADEYYFMENPAKRYKTAQHDDSCFGKGFFCITGKI